MTETKNLLASSDVQLLRVQTCYFGKIPNDADEDEYMGNILGVGDAQILLAQDEEFNFYIKVNNGDLAICDDYMDDVQAKKFIDFINANFGLKISESDSWPLWRLCTGSPDDWDEADIETLSSCGLSLSGGPQDCLNDTSNCGGYSGKYYLYVTGNQEPRNINKGDSIDEAVEDMLGADAAFETVLFLGD